MKLMRIESNWETILGLGHHITSNLLIGVDYFPSILVHHIVHEC